MDEAQDNCSILAKKAKKKRRLNIVRTVWAFIFLVPRFL